MHSLYSDCNDYTQRRKDSKNLVQNVDMSDRIGPVHNTVTALDASQYDNSM